jgi:protease I
MTQSVAFFVSKEGIEQAELTEPWKAVQLSGRTPTLVSPEPGRVQAYQHLAKADAFPVDIALADARPEDYVALVLPGGVANGDLLRWQPGATDFARAFSAAGKPIAVICHGGWVLIDANLVAGRDITSWPSMRVDYRNAGADWTDQEVVVCNKGPTLISSRKPDDLPAFNRELLAALDKVG